MLQNPPIIIVSVLGGGGEKAQGQYTKKSYKIDKYGNIFQIKCN